MILTHEWQEYDRDYQKAVQDIRTKDGKEYLNCWPNAGKFHVMAEEKKDCIQINESEVTHVKLNKSWMSEEQEKKSEQKTKSIGVIGHVDHSITSIAAEAFRILVDNHKPEVILVDEDNLSQVKDKLKFQEKERGITINETLKLPELNKRKSNKGLRIGSYKYKSK